MNCCNANGQCNRGPDCPARAPTYPFAPGTIEGPKAARWASLPDANTLLTRRDNLTILLLVLLMVLLGTVLGGMLAGYLHAPEWLYLGLPG